MKTIVSLALAGLMSISALLPALAAQEAESVSIPESSGISESVAQDESSVSSSGSTADESTEPESGSNTENVPFPVSWTVKMKKKQKETQDILSYHTQAAGCSDKARAKASGGRQPIEECGRTGL